MVLNPEEQQLHWEGAAEAATDSPTGREKQEGHSCAIVCQTQNQCQVRLTWRIPPSRPGRRCDCTSFLIYRWGRSGLEILVSAWGHRRTKLQGLCSSWVLTYDTGVLFPWQLEQVKRQSFLKAEERLKQNKTKQKNGSFEDFPNGPVVKAPHAQSRAPRFNPWSEN